MILTKHILEQISWWETKKSHGNYDSVIIHFKQWWKPSKKFKFPVKVIEWTSDFSCTFKPAVEYIGLLTQLSNYFDNQ